MPDFLSRDTFIKNLYEAEWVPLLPGIRGRSGVCGLPPGLDVQDNMGIDLLDMEPNTSFPLHIHPGAHILFILEGKGTVTIGDQVHITRPGDCYFIPGELEHGVGAIEHHQLLSIGFPHKALDDPARMDIVDTEYLTEQPLMAEIYSGDDADKRRAMLKAFQQENESADEVRD